MAGKEVTIKKVYEAVRLGEKRLHNFRAARLMFLKQYAGPYYDKPKAEIGAMPISLIYNAISILVPNLVTNFPKTLVTSKFMNYRGYAELLGLGVDHLAREIDLRAELRRWIVDGLFTLGIMKTGIATSDSLVSFGDDTQIDPGQPYARVIDFDDFILDPACKRIEEASFVGHRARVPRQMLLDSDLFDNDMVVALSASKSDPSRQKGVDELSQQKTSRTEVSDLQDLVDIREIWVPAAKAIIWMPAESTSYDKYLRIADYGGPEKGDYTYLSFTPPMPSNPMPVPPVGIWYDLHIAANDMLRKIMDQAARQKDILTYQPHAQDDAESIKNAGDGDIIGIYNVDGAKVQSFGGQQQSNEAHLAQISYWFNLMSGNTDQMGGTRSDAETATQATILQQNSAVRTEDMRDLVYIATQHVQEKLAWYLHTDPLIHLPLIKRTPIPARVVMGPNGPIQMPPRMEEEQVILTDDVREGDFLDYHFSIEQKSMSRVDPNKRLQQAMIFASKVLPAAAQAAMVCQQMGVPFSFAKLVTRLAKELDIDWIDEVFFDEGFQAQVLDMFNKTPGPEGSKGQSPGGGMGAILQNGQPGNLPFKGDTGGSELQPNGAGAPREVMSESQPAGMGM